MKKITIAILLASSWLASVSPAFAASPTQATPQTAAQKLNYAFSQETYVLGTNAYLWGSTLVRLEDISRLYTDVSSKQRDTSYRAPLNHFGHARRLPGPSDTDMPSANQDTLYSSAIVDLSQGPIVLSVPQVDKRYYVIDMFDMWHNLFKYVGTRATGTLAQQFLIVPPGWKNNGALPQNLIMVQAPTSKVWLWGRTQVFGAKDYAKVHKIQDQYKLQPLNDYLGHKTSKPMPALSKVAGDKNDPLRFFVALGQYLKANPLPKAQQALLGQFAKIGLTAQGFDPSRLTPVMKEALIKAIHDGPLIVAAQMQSPTTTVAKDGWHYSFKLDHFGNDYALRSLVAHPYLGGQGAIEAMYPLAVTDTKGQWLSGQKSYKMHFKKAPPVGAFWSVTVYDAKTKLFVANSLKRYALSSLSNLKKNQDGSFDLYLSHKLPAKAKQSNWLALPKGGFYMLTRLYIPSKQILDMKWTVPGVQPTN